MASPSDGVVSGGIAPEALSLPFVVPTRSKAASPSKRQLLYAKYRDRLEINADLSRSLVSFQANRQAPFYRWLKYKEAFSSELVQYLIGRCFPRPKPGMRLLDPFAGAGTALTTAASLGWTATGIELLPVGTAAMRARLVADRVDIAAFALSLEQLRRRRSTPGSFIFPHIRITHGAFPEQTDAAISGYMKFLDRIADEDVRFLFWFACLAVLETVSYTRKDGQYLRWDYRSGRKLRAHFDKGSLPSFGQAIEEQLGMMLDDLHHRNGGTVSRSVSLIEGSCLTELPNLPDNAFDLILTSPPYCNRYDYTRTYALELAFMGYGEDAVKSLRQALLSSTVENRTKRVTLEEEYVRNGRADRFNRGVAIYENQRGLQEVLGLLDVARRSGQLNNNNVPNMVAGYFFEMSLLIQEFARVLAPGGRVVMVNDNVQYNGEEVPVDLILSDFAESAGMHVERIWALPKGKGNSSQQMGVHGRTELRKCVYVWSK